MDDACDWASCYHQLQVDDSLARVASLAPRPRLAKYLISLKRRLEASCSSCVEIISSFYVVRSPLERSGGRTVNLFRGKQRGTKEKATGGNTTLEHSRLFPKTAVNYDLSLNLYTQICCTLPSAALFPYRIPLSQELKESFSASCRHIPTLTAF